jgi:large subunit ribosomal protein L17
MRHNNKNKILGRQKGARNSLYRNMATSLFKYESIETTLAKAKAIRPYVEKIITKAKRGNLADNRNIFSEIRDKDIIFKLTSDIGKRFEKRDGGYIRIIKLGHRKGDGSQMAILELVSKKEIKKELLNEKEGVKKEGKPVKKAKSSSKKVDKKVKTLKKVDKKASKAEDKK